MMTCGWIVSIIYQIEVVSDNSLLPLLLPLCPHRFLHPHPRLPRPFLLLLFPLLHRHSLLPRPLLPHRFRLVILEQLKTLLLHPRRARARMMTISNTYTPPHTIHTTHTPHTPHTTHTPHTQHTPETHPHPHPYIHMQIHPHIPLNLFLPLVYHILTFLRPSTPNRKASLPCILPTTSLHPSSFLSLLLLRCIRPTLREISLPLLEVVLRVPVYHSNLKRCYGQMMML